MTATTPLSLTLHPLPANGGANAAAPAASHQADTNFWGADGFTFRDLLDIINPLQQIPIISNIYRKITGDTIAPGARLIGGALLGGVVGAGFALADNVFEQQTGKDVGGSVVAALKGESPDGHPSQLAANDSAAALPAGLRRNASRLYLAAATERMDGATHAVA